MLASRLRILRGTRGWSQEQMAEVSGLHRTYISLVERANCNISLDNIERCANAFGVTAAELLGSDGVAEGRSVLASSKREAKKKRKR
ncbi:MAG: helix-turn-helix transcriptional regulator [Gammaproteobacteria bacterium]|nr:helix-turn-helix transcriptional regulator [Gammaproteobacteria bacterium]